MPARPTHSAAFGSLQGKLASSSHQNLWEHRGRFPEDLGIKIFREAGVAARSHLAQTCSVFNNMIRSGRVRGEFDVNGGSIAAGDGHSVIRTSEGCLLTFGSGY